MKVLLDTNIILDVFLEPEPFVKVAESLDAIITRNPQDFAGATIPILSATKRIGESVLKIGIRD